MRCLGVAACILILSFSLSLSHLFAGELYMWTDADGVLHITDNPRAFPPGDDVETIRYSEENSEQGGQSNRAADVPEEDKAMNSLTDEQVSEGALKQEKWERELRHAREEYEQAKKLVEKRRRQDVRQSSKRSRDAYKDALQKLAEKRERLRMLRRGQ